MTISQRDIPIAGTDRGVDAPQPTGSGADSMPSLINYASEAPEVLVSAGPDSRPSRPGTSERPEDLLAPAQRQPWDY
ncbi:MAG: hypothetical protein ABJC62_12275 [Frankiaceae bacterium]